MMTNEEKFKKGIVVYKTEDDTVCELWNASTKHPDSIFYFSDFKKTPFVDEEHQIFQWLLECASKLTFPMHAKELVEYALKNHVTWEKPSENQAFLFGGARTFLARRIYHYTTSQPICQEKSCTNFSSQQIPKFVHFTYCNPATAVL